MPDGVNPLADKWRRSSDEAGDGVKAVKLSPEKTIEPNVGGLPAKYTLVNLEQLQKQLIPKEVTEDGIVIEVREVQLLKQQPGKEVTEDGIIMDGREEQDPKQYSPKEVTEDGIVTEVREEQPLKQQLGKEVTEDGIVMEVREEQ